MFLILKQLTHISIYLDEPGSSNNTPPAPPNQENSGGPQSNIEDNPDQINL